MKKMTRFMIASLLMLSMAACTPAKNNNNNGSGDGQQQGGGQSEGGGGQSEGGGQAEGGGGQGEGGIDFTENSVGNIYNKVTSAPTSWEGEYIAVYEDEENSEALIFNGETGTFNCASEDLDDSILVTSSLVSALVVESIEGGYSIRLKGENNSGKYIGGKTKDNYIVTSDEPVLTTFTYESTGVKIESNTSVFRFNNGEEQCRFRFFKSTTYTNQQPISLYKLGAAKTYEDLCAAGSGYTHVNAFPKTEIASFLNVSTELNELSFDDLVYKFTDAVAETEYEYGSPSCAEVVVDGDQTTAILGQLDGCVVEYDEEYDIYAGFNGNKDYVLEFAYSAKNDFTTIYIGSTLEVYGDLLEGTTEQNGPFDIDTIFFGSSLDLIPTVDVATANVFDAVEDEGVYALVIKDETYAETYADLLVTAGFDDTLGFFILEYGTEDYTYYIMVFVEVSMNGTDKENYTLIEFMVYGFENDDDDDDDDDDDTGYDVSSWAEVLTYINQFFAKKSISGITVPELEGAFYVELTLDDGYYADCLSIYAEGDGVNAYLQALSDAGYTVPSSAGEYGYECFDATNTVEIDVIYYNGYTIVSIYAYADLYE